MKRHSSVYNLCNDEYRKSLLLNRAKLQKANLKGYRIRGDTLEVNLDEAEAELDDIVTKPGNIIPPDEIVQSVKQSILSIPIRQREEFSKNNPLPDSDTLKVLHYYSSHRLKNQNLQLENSLDETALLAFGVLVDQWIDDMVTESVALMFAEDIPPEESSTNLLEDEEDKNEESDNENESIELRLNPSSSSSSDESSSESGSDSTSESSSDSSSDSSS